MGLFHGQASGHDYIEALEVLPLASYKAFSLNERVFINIDLRAARVRSVGCDDAAVTSRVLCDAWEFFALERIANASPGLLLRARVFSKAIEMRS